MTFPLRTTGVRESLGLQLFVCGLVERLTAADGLHHIDGAIKSGVRESLT